LTKWYEDKNKVKDIFDSFRNYGICGAIFYLGGLFFTLNSSTNSMEIAYMFFGGVFIVISLLLFLLNTIHINKNVIKIEDSTASYLTSFVVIVLGVFLMTQPLLFMKNENGERLGEVPIIGTSEQLDD
jgi:hypothetical protein